MILSYILEQCVPNLNLHLQKLLLRTINIYVKIYSKNIKQKTKLGKSVPEPE